jgi:hypothetical protein
MLNDPSLHARAIWTSVKADRASRLMEDLCALRVLRYGDLVEAVSPDRRFFE